MQIRGFNDNNIELYSKQYNKVQKSKNHKNNITNNIHVHVKVFTFAVFMCVCVSVCMHYSAV